MIFYVLSERAMHVRQSTTRYNFVRLKVTHKISPLEELVGGISPLAAPRG
jgi:hypothetical protein